MKPSAPAPEAITKKEPVAKEVARVQETKSISLESVPKEAPEAPSSPPEEEEAKEKPKPSYASLVSRHTHQTLFVFLFLVSHCFCFVSQLWAGSNKPPQAKNDAPTKPAAASTVPTVHVTTEKPTEATDKGGYFNPCSFDYVVFFVPDFFFLLPVIERSVYLRGLPVDITVDELFNEFSAFGVVKRQSVVIRGKHVRTVLTKSSGLCFISYSIFIYLI